MVKQDGDFHIDEFPVSIESEHNVTWFDIEMQDILFVDRV